MPLGCLHGNLAADRFEVPARLIRREPDEQLPRARGRLQFVPFRLELAIPIQQFAAYAFGQIASLFEDAPARVASAIDDLGIQDRTIMVSPVGCSVFVYYYFDTGNVQAAHGRASAVATGLKRSRPGSIVISYQGDGDLAAIGSAEIMHAANRGENITVFFLNNAIYGMTGGQMAPTTPLGRKTTTSPFGRDPYKEGYPLRISEMLATLEAPAYIERVGLGNPKQIMAAGRAVKRAIRNQVEGLGFSLIEILSPCPTIWKMNATEAQKYLREDLAKTFPLGVFRDRTKDAAPHPMPAPAPAITDLPRLLDIEEDALDAASPEPSLGRKVDASIRVAGFGGQGVLLLGEILAEAGLTAGLEVSWLPSYGPEMRSGTSNCHVRLSSEKVASPLVSRPDVLVALNEPSLRKFIATVAPGGWVFYNGSEMPEGCARADVRSFVRPFAEIADSLGETRAANIVALGAVIEATGLLPVEQVDGALARLVKSARWLEIDRRALAAGRESARS
jgi:2-oxoisovalerate ferredoxin oxidoreductase beta subunit